MLGAMHTTAATHPTVTRQRFVHRYLDPASRLGEILFGLIMVLTITLAAGVTLMKEGRAGVRELLAAAIGCNIAWGIIDAVMYLMNCMTVRAGKIRLVETVQRTPDSQAALKLIEEEVEPELQEFLDPQEARAFSESMLRHLGRARANKTIITKDDVYGAVACFWLVFVSCLPATIPFLIFSQPVTALRVSNLLLICLLFLAGKKWGHYAGVNGWAAGTVMVTIGLVLVAIAIALGG